MTFFSRAVLKVERLASPIVSRLPRGLLRFLCVGVGGLAVDVAVLGLLEQVGLHKGWARLGSLGVATLFTWTLNRHFTFGDSGRAPKAEFSRYAVVAALAQSVNYLVFIGVSDLVPHLPHALAAVIGAVAATAFSYTGQRFFTFARDEAEADA